MARLSLGMGRGPTLVDDELWAEIEPLLPKPPRKSRRGRPRTPDRVALTGIVFVLRTGIPWEDLMEFRLPVIECCIENAE